MSVPERLSQFFKLEVVAEDGVACLYATLPDSNLDKAADLVARGIVIRRLLNERLLQDWISRVENPATEPPSEADVLLLEAHILPNVGTPEHPGSIDHLNGLVAEEIWLQTIGENDLGLGAPIRVDGHDYSVTDTGGDGLTIHKTHKGALSFRLWESKYHGSDKHPMRDTVTSAWRQVQSNALNYLARFSLIMTTITNDVELAQFYGRLTELWVDKDPAAGVSIVVGASQAVAENGCFGAITGYFEFGADHHQGQLNTVGDFAIFADKVRAILWKGCGWTER